MISNGQVIEVVDTYDVVSHIQCIGCQHRTTPLPGGQSRSWSTDQRKKENIKNLAAHPPHPPPRCSFGKNKLKITPRIYMPRRYAGLGRLASAQGFLRLVGWANWYRFARFYASVCDDNFTSLSASLHFWRCLAARLSLLSSTRP